MDPERLKHLHDLVEQRRRQGATGPPHKLVVKRGKEPTEFVRRVGGNRYRLNLGDVEFHHPPQEEPPDIPVPTFWRGVRNLLLIILGGILLGSLFKACSK